MTGTPAPTPQSVTYCQRHPSVETELRCGRCDTPICPRCLVYTPAGTRCPDCAQLRRPPMYEISASHYLRAAAAAVGLGLGMGLVGALLLPPGMGGFLFLTLAIFGGTALGGGVAEVMTRATRGKRGPAIQGAALASLLLAGIVRLVLAGGLDVVSRDLAGMLLLVIAMTVAWGRLR